MAAAGAIGSIEGPDHEGPSAPAGDDPGSTFDVPAFLRRQEG
jgi:hypothetical protein